jgi:hypothetical protein
MTTRLSRKQRRGVRRTRRRLRQRGGANYNGDAKNLREWLGRVQSHRLFGKSEGILEMPFDNFRDPSLQLPELGKNYGQAAAGPDADDTFQLPKPGSTELLFEDSDIRQIGNALRLNPRAKTIESGHTVAEFKSSRPIDSDIDTSEILQKVEQALYSYANPSNNKTISIDDAANYPLFLFYLIMNLPEGMSPDNAIPLTIRTQLPPAAPAAPVP